MYIIIEFLQKHSKTRFKLYLNAFASFETFIKYESRLYALFAGEALDQYYLIIMVPPGIIGNILSFLVSNTKEKENM